MKVLVTGVAGFVGGHLLDFLRAEHPEVGVVGIDRHPGSRSGALGIEVVRCDMADAPAVEQALDRLAPDRIVHLAAQASPQKSWSDPAGTIKTNVLGLLHLLEWVRRRSRWTRLLAVGSAEEYGRVTPADLPIREATPLRPLSPYAVSKVAQGYLALQYALSHGVHVVRTRTFHHTGPRRRDDYAEGSFARQLAEIEAGHRQPALAVGNLDVIRDFTDVRDVVRAYWALLDSGEAGEVYNVCSGRGVRLRDLLQALIDHAGLSIDVRPDPARLRPVDVPELVGDPGRVRAATGWTPAIPLETTLRDLLDHWRERVRAAPAQPAS
jgi:GDP-4-dehydro-6-deoxy-D-mannose reductase